MSENDHGEKLLDSDLNRARNDADDGLSSTPESASQSTLDEASSGSGEAKRAKLGSSEQDADTGSEAADGPATKADRSSADVPEQPLKSKNLFTPSKISELAKTNIFTEAGSERVKKQSAFLQTSLIEVQKGAPAEVRDSLFAQPAKISYLEGDEWIHFGDGEVQVVGDRFLFIRDGFKMVLLNFEYGKTAFTRKDGAVLFEGRGKKSTGSGFEVVDRRYKIEFEHRGSADKFLSLVNKDRL